MLKGGREGTEPWQVVGLVFGSVHFQAAQNSQFFFARPYQENALLLAVPSESCASFGV